ncbi:MAG: 1-acyl-sn-glycerol-3-phosphate acyltransferase, partial [Methylobacteriaceae bacterium]
MTRVGIGLRLFVQALAFLIVIGPHWLSLRFGRGWVAARIAMLFHLLSFLLFSFRVTQSGTPPQPGEPALVLSNH